MKNILILDDDPVILEIIKNELDSLKDCKIFLASNGVEGLDILNSVKVDLIITDILMPEFDGIQLISYLNENQINIPVLVITSVKDTDVINQVISLGITNILKKPIDFSELKKKINIAIKSHGTFEKNLDLLSLCKLFFIEKKSSEISVAKENSSGTLCVKMGQITYAEFDLLKGKKAVEKIFSLSDLKIDLKGKCNRTENNISEDDTKYISEKFFNSGDRKKPGLNISIINGAIEKLKIDLGERLLATSIWDTINLQTIAEFNYDKETFSSFNNVEVHLNNALKQGDFPELDDYYILNMKKDRMILVLLLGNYHWGLMVLRKDGVMGLLISVIIPELQKVFKSALS